MSDPRDDLMPGDEDAILAQLHTRSFAEEYIRLFGHDQSSFSTSGIFPKRFMEFDEDKPRDKTFRWFCDTYPVVMPTRTIGITGV